jgi:hypothetical protein
MDGPVGSGGGTASEKEQRRARRSEEVERKNEKHMLEQVCTLIVTRGLTSRGSKAPSAPATLSPSPPLPLPIDSKLCDRMTDRLVTLLKVPAATARSILVQAHNKHVGYTAQ